ncbi:GIY-YIG nuclease family protein [Rothia sp. AR01]|uniref:GIY-YIG nuclease family protein n=1 Tax=Rothia santali TaxID=2949643 RepID=A0A9X2KI90_9MICC|nr:GIY-YIG nuclease family protein [Rothia santali]MCP3425619.1 GIY-YIG nuclease family protein [Rothia santali]
MPTNPDPSFALSLGDILRSAGLDPAEVLLIRHTYNPDGIGTRVEATPERLRAYTREQSARPGKFPASPPRWWLIFLAETGRRCRLAMVYENHGEATGERTDEHRYYDVRESGVLASLCDRLLIEWTRDTVNWAKRGALGSRLPVVEIADPHVLEFPGYERVLLTYEELQRLLADSAYVRWRAALGSVQGIYLIADTATGKLYVGKADGGERILGRWAAYARDGHGGNVAMRELLDLDPAQPRRYLFSLLHVYGPQATQAEIDAAESHFKDALLTRRFGLNRN